MSIRIAQPYSTDELVTTKLSAYLKVAGVGAAIPVDDGAVIDATNCTAVTHGDTTYVMLKDDGVDFTGHGYMYVGASAATGRTGGASISYLVQSEIGGKFNFWVRAKASGSVLFTASIDGSVFASNSLSLTSSYGWASFDFVLPDADPHTITIAPDSTGVSIDKVYITASATTPAGDGPAYTDATYASVHARVFSLSGGSPDAALAQYDVKSTASGVEYDDWYNFDVSPLDTVSAASERAAVLSVSGSAGVTWELTETGEYTIYKSSTGGAWSGEERTVALRAFADHSVSADCGISTPPAELVTEDINDFDVAANLPRFDNTVTVADGVGGDDVELDLSDKIITIISDESGSMSWQDRGGVRHQMTRELIDRLEAAYPSELKYNLVRVGAKPVFPVVVPLLTKIPSNDFSEIIRESFLPYADNFSGYRVVRKIGSYPESPIDGEIVGDGYMISAADVDLETGTEYFYTVYTYDPGYRFSKGVQIKATPRTRVIPSGIQSFTGRLVKGSGVVIDDYTEAIWHMNEGSGVESYDFSPSRLTISLGDDGIRWLNGEVPIGISALRFDGQNQQSSTASTTLLTFGSTSEFTFIGWVKPFAASGVEAICAKTDTGKINWAVSRDGLSLKFTMDFVNFATSSASLEVGEWNHVAIVYAAGSVKFYINGVLVSTVSLTVGGSHSDDDMPVNVGWDKGGSLSPFFGAVTEFSIHSTARDAAYILAASSTAGNQDNADRLVVLDYTIPDDYDYAGGTYRIVRNKKRPPFHENDGDTVYEADAEPGNYTFAASGYYDLTYTYYFRIFTRNTTGNWSDVEDSGLVQVVIEDIERDTTVEDDESNPLGPPRERKQGPGFGGTAAPTIVVARAGNQKVHIRWTLDDDPTIARVHVYANGILPPPLNKKSYPYVKDGSIVGDLVFQGTADDLEFVHRELSNNDVNYYAVVTVDRHMRFSSLQYAKVTPLDGDYQSDSGIPLHEATAVRYRVTDYDRLTISWDTPFQINRSATGYFDQEVYFYAGLLDYTGSPIPIDYPQNFSIVPEVGSINIRTIEDVFNLGGDAETVKTLPRVNFHVNAGGMILGSLRLANHPVLSIVDSVSFNLNITYKIGDRFEYKFPQTSVTLSNPLSMALLNKDAATVLLPCQSEKEDETGEKQTVTKYLDGAYVRRRTPFALRADIRFRDVPVRDATTTIRVYDGKDADLKSSGACFLLPNLARSSPTVTVLTRQFQVEQSSVELLDTDGNPTGRFDDRSFVDFSLKIPNLPQKAAVYVMVTHGGYSVVRKMNLYFPNILNISVTGTAPSPNGVDVKEQYARAWLIDPDNPNDRSKDTVVPNNTIIKWELKPQGNAPSRPFYSLDAVPARGVYSYTVNGTGRNVFFGPAQDVKTDEKYKLKASIVVSGLTADDSADLEILPLGEIPYEDITDPDAPKFLMEFPESHNVVWADGEDWIKLTISRNPATSTTRFADCFRDCVDTLIPFRVGTKVHINAPGWTIYHGDVFEDVDEYTGETELMDENASVGEDSADVTILSGDYTYVYFRRNTFVRDNSKSLTGYGGGSCGTCPEDDPEVNTPSTIVTGSTKIVYSGKPTAMVGGGGSDGVPVTVLTAKEPFRFRIVGIKANGQFVDKITVDGTTTHQVLLEASWKDGPVPDGTPVKVIPVVRGDKEIDLPQTVLLRAATRTDVNPDGPARSFATLNIPAISPDTTFNVGVMFECNYNKVGTVDRTRRAAVTFGFVLNKPPEVSPPSNVITNRFDRYDMSGCGTVSLAAMSEARAGHCMETDCDYVYAIGGTDGSVIRRTVEAYSLSDDQWDDRAPMDTPRVFAQSVMAGSYIYVMGGLTIDPDTNQITVSDSLERYNTDTDTWTTLEPMPKGVAFGAAKIVGSKIYVLNGYTSAITENSEHVYAYNISTDEWEVSADFGDLEIAVYQRISPFAFVVGTDIHVCGGLYHYNPADFGDTDTPPTTTYLTSAYKYDTLTGEITRSDGFYRNLPIPRYRGATASFGNDHYLIGGANETRPSLRVIERVNTSSSPFTYEESECRLVPGRSGMAAVAGDCGYGTYVYASGGITSGRSQGFLRMVVDATPSSVRLQGVQTAAINVRVFDENGDAPEEVTVRVQGYLGEDGVADIDRSSQPSLLKTDQIVVRNGKGVATLFPRSDDFTDADGDAMSMTTGTLRSYTLSARASIIDDFYEGESDVNFGATDDAPSGGGVGGGVIGDGGTIDFGDGVEVQAYGTSQVFQSSSVGAIITGQGTRVFNLSPSAIPYGDSATVNYYSDFNWIPQVDAIIDDNGGTYDRVVEELDRLKMGIPFGPSPLYDAVSKAATLFSLDNTNTRKMVYLLSDGDENLSFNSLVSAVSQLDLIDGTRQVPVVAGYVNVVPSAMNLNKGRRVTNTGMEEIATLTGGNSFAIVSDDDISRYVDHTVAGGPGSIGYGTFQYTIDLGEPSPVYSVTANFDLPLNTDASWKIRLAGDDKRFSDYVDSLSAGTTWYLENREARYIEFSTILTSDMVTSEYGNSSPAMTDIQVVYHQSKTSYLFLSLREEASDVHQLSATLDAARPDGSRIDVGVSTSDRCDWSAYADDSRRVVDQSGKIVIPVRRKVSVNSTLEPLDFVDRFTVSARYGPWDPSAVAAVFDASDEAVDEAEYQVYPREGYVVFNTPVSGDMYLSVTNPSGIKVAARIVNKISGDPVVIKGAAYMYTTAAPQPLSTPDAVQAFNLSLLPFNPNENSVFYAKYDFYDNNGKDEDATKTQVKWYKLNDKGEPEEIADLAGLLTFDNKTAKLLAAGDVAWFTVRPSNGKTFGRVVKSLPVTIRSDSSVQAFNLSILPASPNADSRFIAVYDYADRDGIAESGSQIRWYKNGQLVPSLNDLTSWFNTGTPTASVAANDTLYFTVRPSNGVVFGATVKSATVVINAL